MANDKPSQDVIQVQGRMMLGYGVIPKMVMQDQRLTIEAKAIYSYFCSYAGAGTTAFPSRNKILYDLKISEDRYYRHFGALKKYGYITVEQSTDEAGKFKRNVYTLVEMPSLDEFSDQDPPRPQNKGTGPYPYFPDTDEPDTDIPYTDEPYTGFPGTDIPRTDNKGTNNNSIKNNNLKNNKRKKSSQSQSHSQTTPIQEDTDLTLTSDPDLFSPYQKSILEKEKAPAVMPIRPYQQAEAAKYIQRDYNTYLEIIKENIEYDILTEQERSNETIDSLIHIMLDVILTESPSTVNIGKEKKSREIVKSIYLKLNAEHIQHVIMQYKSQQHPIKYKTAYLRTMLYNAYQEIDLHYVNLYQANKTY